MNGLSFGFMDPSRGAAANSGLFRRLRSQAVESFSKRRVCRLTGLEPEATDDCHKCLSDGLGRMIGTIRDSLYSAVGGTMGVAEIESYFLYSFTVGVNTFAPMLLKKEHRSDASLLPANEILARRLPIHGPGWLATAVDREMPAVAGVFSDFQSNIVAPIAKISPDSPRLLADAIAGTFLWAFVGGDYWFRELALDVCGGLANSTDPPNWGGRHMCELKKSTQLIAYSDLGRLCLLATHFSKGARKLASGARWSPTRGRVLSKR